MEEHFIYNSTVIIVMAVAIMGGMGFWAWQVMKNNPGMDLGELMATKAVDKNETIFMFSIIGIFLAEGIVASTVHAPGQEPPPLMGRLLSHIFISVIGTVASITAVRDIAVIFMPGLPISERLIKTLIAALIAIIALAVPYFNIMLIADGLGKYLEFELWVYSLYASEENWQAILRGFNLESDYSAFGAFPTILKTSVVLGMLHYALNILEGGRNIASIRRRNMLFAKIREDMKREEEKAKGAVKDSPMPGEQRASNQVGKNARVLLSRLNYEGDSLANMVRLTEQAIDRIKDDDVRMKMAARMGGLVTEVKTIDNSTANDKETKKTALMTKIVDFFQSKNDDSLPIDKRGLSISVKGGRSPKT